jgi:hypothetical protein
MPVWASKNLVITKTNVAQLPFRFFTRPAGQSPSAPQKAASDEVAFFITHVLRLYHIK